MAPRMFLTSFDVVVGFAACRAGGGRTHVRGRDGAGAECAQVGGEAACIGRDGLPARPVADGQVEVVPGDGAVAAGSVHCGQIDSRLGGELADDRRDSDPWRSRSRARHRGGGWRGDLGGDRLGDDRRHGEGRGGDGCRADGRLLGSDHRERGADRDGRTFRDQQPFDHTGVEALDLDRRLGGVHHRLLADVEVHETANERHLTAFTAWLDQ
jgi:hypothetical protein